MSQLGNIRRPDLLNVTGAGTIPAGTAGTGTLTDDVDDATRIINGTSGIFTDEHLGWYIHETTGNQIRKIVGVQPDQDLVIVESAFDTALAGDSFEFINPGDLPRAVSITNTGGADGVINTLVRENVTFPAGFAHTWSNDEFQAVEPIAYDATGTTFMIGTLD